MSRIHGLDDLLQVFAQQATQERAVQLSSQQGLSDIIIQLLAHENQSLGRRGPMAPKKKLPGPVHPSGVARYNY